MTEKTPPMTEKTTSHLQTTAEVLKEFEFGKGMVHWLETKILHH